MGLFCTFLRDISKGYSVRRYGKAQMNILANPVYFFPHPVELSACHVPPTMSGTTVIQLNCSLWWGLFIYFLYDSLIPTVVSIQGMDVRCSATFPTGDGHLPPGQWESHSWTQLVRFCHCQEASNLGCHSWRVKWEMPWHPALHFFLQPQLFLVQPAPSQWKGKQGVLARTPVAPNTVGAPSSQGLKLRVTDSMLLTTGDVLLPKDLSIRPHPEKWSPWMQYKSPFSSHRGAGKPKGQRDPSTPAAPWGCDVIWPGSLQWAAHLSASSTRSEHPLLGKKVRWGEDSPQGC